MLKCFRDKNLQSIDKAEIDFIREQMENLVTENKALKEQCQHVSNQLDIALVQVIIIMFLKIKKYSILI